MLIETEFHKIADATLIALLDVLEAADLDGELESEFEAGALCVQLPSKKQYLISKHVTSRQLWVASPISGGLHFIYQSDGTWRLNNGRELTAFVRAEIAALSGVKL